MNNAQAARVPIAGRVPAELYDALMRLVPDPTAPGAKSEALRLALDAWHSGTPHALASRNTALQSADDPSVV